MDLQLALIILGGFAITGILVHGLWTIRNNSQKQNYWDPVQKELENVDNAGTDDSDIDDDLSHYEQPPQTNKSLAGGFDHDGIGQVRVIQREVKPLETSQADNGLDDTDDFSVTEPLAENTSAQQSSSPYAAQSSNPSASTQSVPSFSALDEASPDTATPEAEMNLGNETKTTSAQYHYPEPPSSLLLAGEQGQSSQHKMEPSIRQSEFLEDSPAQSERQEPIMDGEQTTLAESVSQSHFKSDDRKPPESVKISLAEQAKKLVKREKPLKKIRRTEPRITEDQMRIDFDDQPSVENVQQVESTHSEQAPEQEQEVLVLNVKMPDEKTIPGSALLPMLLTLGLKFGDQDIFHRHVNTNGKGPILFSLANMFRPGVFDIDNMEIFTTRGISLFMVLPIEGDPRQVFNMMHNASRKIADEFGAQILDGRRAILTKQALQQYTDKIRESERRKMLRKN